MLVPLLQLKHMLWIYNWKQHLISCNSLQKAIKNKSSVNQKHCIQMKHQGLWPEVDLQAGSNTSLLAFTSVPQHSVPLPWSGLAWCPSQRDFLTSKSSCRALQLPLKRAALAALLAAFLPDPLAIRSNDIWEGWWAGGKSIQQPTSRLLLLLPDLVCLNFPSRSSNGRLQNLKNL